MKKLDTLTGKYHAHFWFYDEYQIFDQVPGNEEIDIKTNAIFTTEADADAAEDLAFDAFVATLKATGQQRMARIIEKDKRHD